MGTHTLTAANNSAFGPTGLPVVSTPITIEGNGSTINRDPMASNTFRIFAINSSGNLTLNETTVSGGAAVVSFPGGRGGGVYNRGTLTLTRSTVSGNSAGNGGGVFNYYGTATLFDSTVSGNSAGGNGGGVGNLVRGRATGSTATLSRTVVSGNTASAGL